MESPPETQLSRAVSAVDLNASLSAVREHPDESTQYAHKAVKNIRADHDYEKLRDKVDAASPDGILTPPNLTAPNPPPPTPASSNFIADAFHSDENTVVVPEENFDLEPMSEENFDLEQAPEENFDLEQAPEENFDLEQMPEENYEVEQAPPKKKKKKKKKSKANSATVRKPPPSGFEEYFADPPIRPDEYAEERELYDKSHAFQDRIESCIQRFRARRKLDQVRANVFTKYLALGGIDTGPKQFTGGVDNETIENSTVDEITAIQATDYIYTNQRNPKFYDGSDKWVVDFEGVAKGFFSQELPNRLPLDTKHQLQTYCAVIRNFLNYVLHHEVCPEYTADVMAARKIVDLAEEELWAILQMSSKLPGDFNVAASILYCGRYYNPWGYGCWEDDDPKNEEYSNILKGFSRVQAARIVKTGIAFSGDKEMFQRIQNPDIKIIKDETRYFEVVKIEFLDPVIAAHQKNVSKDDQDLAKIKPLGIVTFKNWEGPNLEQEDFSDDESEALPSESATESYFLDEEALNAIFIGLKLEVITQELNIGLKFIDSIVGLNCSFYTFLPNKRMTGFKVPVPSSKPAPTEDDPEIEERMISEMIEREMQNE